MTIETDLLWTRIQSIFDDLLAELLRVQGQATCAVGTNSNDDFPFRAYASLGLKGGETELVVVSIDCRRDGDSLRCSADIALPNGIILAEPRELIGPAEEVAVLFERWTTEFAAFLKAHISTLLKVLAAPT